MSEDFSHLPTIDGLIVVTPGFPPQFGGAAQYASMLADFLVTRPEVARVAVIAPHVRGQPASHTTEKLTVYRVLPGVPSFARSVAAARILARLVSDLVLLITLVALRSRGYRVLHLHGNFVTFGGKLPNLGLELLLAALRFRAILDLRDPLVPPRPTAVWVATLCASRAIRDRAIGAGVSPGRCHLVPTPIDARRIRDAAERGAASLGIIADGRPYLCYVGELTPRKGIEELLEGFSDYRNRHHNQDLALVLIGPIFTSSVQERRWRLRFREDPDLYYLGGRTWEQTLALMARSKVVILASRAEGMPRVCLEAMTLGCHVLLPPGIDEFSSVSPDIVVEVVESMAITKAIARSIANPMGPTYDLAPHNSAAVFARYLAIYQHDGRIVPGLEAKD